MAASGGYYILVAGQTPADYWAWGVAFLGVILIGGQLDKEKGISSFVEALKIDPMREVLREDVARLAPTVNGWEQVVAAYEAGIQAAADEDALVLYACARALQWIALDDVVAHAEARIRFVP